jgi:purine-binding chemotaxis protein CheW
MIMRAAVCDRTEESASSLIELCSVRVGETLYGMPISHVVEILGSIRPQPVPLAPDFVAGLVHYRGEVLTTVSLRQLLGLSRATGPQDILVLESPASCFGLLVDSVGEVLTVRAEDFEPNPSTLSESRANLFAGACKLMGSLLVLLNPEHLDPIRLGAVYAS